MHKKSKDYLLGSILLVSACGALVLVAIPFVVIESPGNPNNPGVRKAHRTAIVLASIGFGVGLSSLPNWLKWGKYKKKAKLAKF